MSFIQHSNLKFLREGWQKDVHIISAGPSLRGFDFSELRSKQIMTLNNSIFHIPIKSNYHVYCEPINKEKENYIRMSQFPYVKRFSIHDYPGWYYIPGFSGIENFAFQVSILIAKYMGFKTINLYGYDFSFIDGYKYWWSDDKVENSEEKAYILEKQHTIFKQFIQKIDKDIKINIVKPGIIVPIKDYLSE